MPSECKRRHGTSQGWWRSRCRTNPNSSARAPPDASSTQVGPRGSRCNCPSLLLYFKAYTFVFKFFGLISQISPFNRAYKARHSQKFSLQIGFVATDLATWCGRRAKTAATDSGLTVTSCFSPSTAFSASVHDNEENGNAHFLVSSQLTGRTWPLNPGTILKSVCHCCGSEIRKREIKS